MTVNATAQYCADTGDITRWRGDMDFILEFQDQYLPSEAA